MRKVTKLRLCDWSLLLVSVVMLVSSVQLEGWWLGMPFIWLHITLGIILFVLIIWHLQLHFLWQNWFCRLRAQKSQVTKWLSAFGTVTLLTAVAATIHMFISWQHSAIGGWHGKFGFVFIALTAAHVIGHVKFLKK